MFKVKAADGRNNISGEMIRRLRLEREPPLSQRGLARLLQTAGCDLDHYAIRRIENGERFVTDIEIIAIADVFGIGTDDLLGRKTRR